jgi:hypothetical protein
MRGDCFAALAMTGDDIRLVAALAMTGDDIRFVVALAMTVR